MTGHHLSFRPFLSGRRPRVQVTNSPSSNVHLLARADSSTASPPPTPEPSSLRYTSPKWANQTTPSKTASSTNPSPTATLSGTTMPNSSPGQNRTPKSLANKPRPSPTARNTRTGRGSPTARSARRTTVSTDMSRRGMATRRR